MCNPDQKSQIYILNDVNVYPISIVYKTWSDSLHHFSGQPLSTSFLNDMWWQLFSILGRQQALENHGHLLGLRLSYLFNFKSKTLDIQFLFPSLDQLWHVLITRKYKLF